MFPLDEKVLEKTLLVGNVNPLISAEQVHLFCICAFSIGCGVVFAAQYDPTCGGGQPLPSSRALCVGLLVCSLLTHAHWTLVAWWPPVRPAPC